MKKLIVALFILLASLSAQVEHSQGINPTTDEPAFYIDLIYYKNLKPELSTLDVFLQVPYSSVLFVKTVNGYEGNYTFTLTFYDEDQDNILFERMWKENITVKEFGQTASDLNYNFSYKSMELKPRKYFLIARFEDSDSKEAFKYEGPVSLPSFSDRISMSDILLIKEIVKKDDAETIIPNVTRIVSNADSVLSFFYEIYSDLDGGILAEYKIFDKGRDKNNTQIEQIQLKKGVNPITYTFSDTDFRLGDFELHIVLKSESEKAIAQKTKKFRSKIRGFPNIIKDLEKAIDQMVYIASVDEQDHILEPASYEERLNRFIEYWKAKDPSPTTEENEVLNEYYRRVSYSNANFKSFNEGWRSDMGMIYITLGPPNQVERNPMQVDSKPYEIWDYYNLNRRFVFVDETGFGDYRLLNPMYGDWYRYRQ